MPRKALKLKIGVIGAGRIADIHLKALAANPYARVVAIADQNLDMARQRAQEYDINRTYGNYSALLAEERVDAVDIILPHHLHFPAMKEAIEAGNHVFCEKPIALSISDADALLNLARRLGRGVFIKSYQRFVPVHQHVKSLLSHGAMGMPYLASALVASDRVSALQDPEDWHGNWEKCGGGVLMDTGIHLIDLLHYWFGDAVAVTAMCRRAVSQNAEKAEDLSLAYIEYASDLVAEIVCTWADNSLGFRWEKHVYCRSASVHIMDDGADTTLTVATNGNTEFLNRDTNWWKMANVAAVNDMVDCLIRGADLTASAEEAHRTLRTVLACYESSRVGHRIDLANFEGGEAKPNSFCVR